jgi:hypothetical protein
MAKTLHTIFSLIAIFLPKRKRKAHVCVKISILTDKVIAGKTSTFVKNAKMQHRTVSIYALPAGITAVSTYLVYVILHILSIV